MPSQVSSTHLYNMDQQGHSCLRRSNDWIKEFLETQLRAESFQLPDESAIPSMMAQCIAEHCNGLEYMARLRLCMFEYRDIVYQESELDLVWLRFFCGPFCNESIYTVAFYSIMQDSARATVALPAISWALSKRSEDFATFLRSPEMEYLAIRFGDRTETERAHLVRDACGGFVHICEAGTGFSISMDDEVRYWIWANRRREVPLSNAPEYAARIVYDMIYILSAYEQHHNLPCLDDTSMENLLRENPRLESAASNFVVHLRGAHEIPALHNHGQWEQILGYLTNTGFLHCLQQIEGASLDKDRLCGWSQSYQYDISRLAWAASKNLPVLVAHLLSSGFPLEGRGSDGLTALAAAAQNGHRDMVVYLLQNGSDLEARDLAGDTPLALASSYGHHEVVKLLLSRGANKDSPAYDFARPLTIAASNAQHQVVQTLHLNNASRHSADTYGETYVSHMIRHSWADLSLYFPPTSGGWLRDIPFEGKRHAAVCRAMYSNSKTSGRRQYERFLGPTDRHSQLPSIPFGYVPGAVRQQYVLVERLGSGAFGTWYSAINRRTGRGHAMKGSQSYRSTDPQSLQHRYDIEKAELKFLKTVNHKNVMSLQNYIDKNSYIFMISEIADCNLTQYMEHTKISDEEIRLMMIQLLTGTEYLHHNNIIHCDLKPDNVLVMDGGETFKLSDLGNSARALRYPDLGIEKGIHNCAGTPGYISPEGSRQMELLQNDSPLVAQAISGPPCDVYSLGVMMLQAYAYIYERELEEALSGETDHPRIRLHATIQQYIEEDFYWNHIPLEYANLIRRMLSPTPEDRPTVNECLAELHAIPEKIRQRELLAKRLRRESEELDEKFQTMDEAFDKWMDARAAQGLIDGRKKDRTLRKRAHKEVDRQKHIMRRQKIHYASIKAERKAKHAVDLWMDLGSPCFY